MVHPVAQGTMLGRAIETLLPYPTRPSWCEKQGWARALGSPHTPWQVSRLHLLPRPWDPSVHAVGRHEHQHQGKLSEQVIFSTTAYSAQCQKELLGQPSLGDELHFLP